MCSYMNVITKAKVLTVAKVDLLDLSILISKQPPPYFIPNTVVPLSLSHNHNNAGVFAHALPIVWNAGLFSYFLKGSTYQKSSHWSPYIK